MDDGRNSKGKWRVVVTKVVKVGKKLKKPGKLLKKAIGSICRILFSSVSTASARRDPIQRFEEEKLAFMFFILQSKTGKPGWQKSVIALLKQCKGVRFQMDGDGRMEVSGIGNPDQLMIKISKSSKVEIKWIQSSQCSATLFPPQPTKKEENPSTVQQHNNNNNNNINPPRLPTGYGYPYQYDQYPRRHGLYGYSNGYVARRP